MRDPVAAKHWVDEQAGKLELPPQLAYVIAPPAIRRMRRRRWNPRVERRFLGHVSHGNVPVFHQRIEMFATGPDGEAGPGLV
jgi:hypothetical protein